MAGETVTCSRCEGPMVLDVDTDRWYCDTLRCLRFGQQMTDAEMVAAYREVHPRPAVEVHQVLPGSIIVLRDVALDGEHGEWLVGEVARVIGHEKFVVLTTVHGGDVEVWGPDTDVATRLRQLLEEAKMGDQPNALTGVPGGASEQPRAVPPAGERPPGKTRIPVAPDEEPDSDVRS